MQYFLSLLGLTALCISPAISQPTTNSTLNDAGLSSSLVAPVATLCDQYAYHQDNGYEFNNNLWGRDSASSGSQCTYYNGRSGNGVKFSSDWTWRGADNAVKSFIYANRMFTRRTISNIGSLPTTVRWSYDTSNIRANVAYDIFTHPDPNHVNYNGEYELMIWLGSYGGVWPITESPTGTPLETVNIAGYQFALHRGWNGSMRVYSFVTAQGPITSFNADVMLFFRHLISRYSFPANNQYMLIYQFGTEPFTGGPAKFDVSQFEANVY